MPHVSPRRRSALALALVASFLGSCFTSTLTFHNETTRPLVPYPVVTNPPPPHREANLAGEVPIQGSTTLDPDGFNPLFFAVEVADPAAPNAVYLGFDLYEADPAVILARVLHYPGFPGAEVADPSLTPTVLSEVLVEVPDVDHEIRVVEKPSDTPGVPVWEVSVTPTP